MLWKAQTPWRLNDKTRASAMLIFFYTLQGVPGGLSNSIPVILALHKVGYQRLAWFSLASWPFSLKLLWAPVVDSVYSERIGRRKSWLVPIQIAIGLLMMYIGYSFHTLVSLSDSPPSGEEGGGIYVDMFRLTVLYLLMYFLTATQDITVDGWGLTLFPRHLRAYASICNTIGKTTGEFLGYTVFLALNSKDFCNNYLRSSDNQQETGILDLPDFLFFWGFVFLLSAIIATQIKEIKDEKQLLEASPKEGGSPATTGEISSSLTPNHSPAPSENTSRTLSVEETDKENKIQSISSSSISSSISGSMGSMGEIEMEQLKRVNQNVAEQRNEPVIPSTPPPKPKRGKHDPHESLIETYIEMWGVLTLPNIIIMATILLTYKVSFAASDLLPLKLMEKGMTKDTMAFMSIVRLPMTIFVPVLIRRWTMGRLARPLTLWLKAFPYRVLMNIVAACLVYGAPDLTIGNYATYRFYVLFVISNMLKQITVEVMHASRSAFYARVADPHIGGTYLTLLNTISNLGIKWPHTAALTLVDAFSVEGLKQGKRKPPVVPHSLSDDAITTSILAQSIWQDGYYTLTLLCTVFGLVWYLWFYTKVSNLQDTSLDSWKVSHHQTLKAEANIENRAPEGSKDTGKLLKPSD